MRPRARVILPATGRSSARAMSGTRFWSVPPGTSPRPAHKRTRSNYDPEANIRPVIYIYWPSSRPLQLALITAACSISGLLYYIVSTSLNTHTRNPGVSVQEPEWLKNSFLDALIKCEKGLPLPAFDTHPNAFVFPTSHSPMAHLATTYRALRHTQAESPLVLPKRLPQRAALNFPHSCLERAIAQGQPCSSGSAPRDPPTLDVVWTWTNGSDPLHFRARRIAEMAEPRFIQPLANPRGAKKVGAEDKLFREHDELRHSVRSVLDHFRPWSTRFHILAADFPFPSCNLTDAANARLGQVPQWLDMNQSSWQDGAVSLGVFHHAEFMSNYHQTTFSSLSIESQFANLNLSEAFIYMNDDIFFMAPMTPWDFYTYAYGPVLRMQSDLMVPPTTRDTKKAHGEWETLQYSNKLLGDRFGQRYRPYTAHEAKTLVKSIVEEVTITWNAELHHTGLQRFRMNPDAKDAYLPFLVTHWIVERHREALLWSWVVARLGGDDDEWGPAQSAQAWHELGGALDKDQVDVRRKPRSSLLEDQLIAVLESTGDTSIGRSQYAYLSRDGYPYSSLGRFGWNAWPSFRPKTKEGGPGLFSDPGSRCTISRKECLSVHGSRTRGASGIFTRLAFEVPHCGDCIITALVASSGDLGLSAFLPASDRVWAPWNDSSRAADPSIAVAPHLPLAADYRAANFTLGHVFSQSRGQTSSVRNWTTELIARYRFTIGITPSHFAMLRNPNTIKALFSRIEKKIHADDKIQNITMLCLNDDISLQLEQSDELLREWQDKRWPRKATWEL